MTDPNQVLQIDGTYTATKLYVGGPARSWPPAGVDANPPLGQHCDAKLDATGTVPKRIPRAYYTQCAGCHGPTGAGGNGYPNLVNRHTQATFTNFVRKGYTGSLGLMPHFDAERLSDADLARVYGYLNAAPVLEQGNCAADEGIDDATYASVYARGLAAWRTQNANRDNAGCFQCHGPDGLTFACFGYSDGDILRRANTHLDEEGMFAVLDMVHALRQKYAIVPRDPLQARPLQPGGVLLDGNSAAERDLNFGRQLRKMGLKLANGYINDSAAAAQSAREIDAINLHALRIPIPFNRLTEDKSHNFDDAALDCSGDIDKCDDHGSLSDWMPIQPHVGQNNNDMFAKQDAYLADPKLDTFYKVYHAVPNATTLAGPFPSIYNSGVDHQKYAAQFTLDYCIRREVMGLPGCYDTNRPVFAFEQRINDIWGEGEYANLFAAGLSTQPACDVGNATCNPPQAAFFYTKLSKGAKLSDSAQRLRHPWFLMHMLHFDPTLLNTGDDPTIQQSEYLTRSLFWSNNDNNGSGNANNPTYSVFAAFQVTLHNIKQLSAPDYASCDKMPNVHPDNPRGVPIACTAVDLRSGYYPMLCNFAEGKDWYNDSSWQLDYVPKDAERKELYQTIAGNMYRMMLRGLIHQLQQDNWMCSTDMQGYRVARAK